MWQQVRCAFTDLWAVWDFREWFNSHGIGPVGAWPNPIQNWAKRGKAVLSVRLSRSYERPSET